jgi:phosphatidate cytidylyltransferase
VEDGLTRERLFGYQHAFDHPVTVWITLGVAALLVLAGAVILLVSAPGRSGAPLRKELLQRYVSWLILTPLIIVPVLLGAAWMMAAVTLLSLACFGEYARSTGLFREKATSLVVVLGILAISFAVVDHWYGFFVALPSLTVGAIAATAILLDQPKGYIQRVALGVFGFMLFGFALAHLGYVGNDERYRPIVLMVLACTQLNDVFAYVVGKTLGRRRLAPSTSPNKTVEGAAGALLLTTTLAAFLGHHVFVGTPLDRPVLLVLLGVVISVVGQLGDLTLSSIKRDLGIKDMAVTIPGHGGLLDRFISLILVSPAVFHYVHYIVGLGLDQPTRIISGG